MTQYRDSSSEKKNPESIKQEYLLKLKESLNTPNKQARLEKLKEKIKRI